MYSKNSNGPKIELVAHHILSSVLMKQNFLLDTFGVDLQDMILIGQELDLLFHKIPAFSVECHD
jgi:hypothetical protein